MPRSCSLVGRFRCGYFQVVSLVPRGVREGRTCYGASGLSSKSDGTSGCTFACLCRFVDLSVTGRGTAGIGVRFALFGRGSTTGRR